MSALTVYAANAALAIRTSLSDRTNFVLQSLHLIAAFRLTGKATNAQIIKALKSNGPPPRFVDRTSFYSTPVLDGGLSQTTPLPLTRPGRYVLFCPINDRNGGKPHFEEGLLTTVTEQYDRVSIHGVRRSLLYAQAESLGLPLHEVLLQPQSKITRTVEPIRVVAVTRLRAPTIPSRRTGSTTRRR